MYPCPVGNLNLANVKDTIHRRAKIMIWPVRLSKWALATAILRSQHGNPRQNPKGLIASRLHHVMKCERTHMRPNT